MKRATALLAAFLSLAACTSVGAQNPAPGSGTVTQASVVFLNEATVRKELGLSTAEGDRIVREFKNFNDTLRQTKRPTTQQEAQATGQKIRTMQLGLVTRVMAMLTSAQTGRLREIGLQYFGPFSLLSPDIAKELALSDGQTKKIRQAQSDLIKRANALQQLRVGELKAIPKPANEQDQAAVQAYMKKVNAIAQSKSAGDKKTLMAARKQAEAKAIAALTPTQKTKWTAMLGKAFKMPKSMGWHRVARPSILELPMGPLDERFRLLRARGERALVLFATAGDPPLDQMPSLLEALQEAGADVLEVGIPFSDPIADGPTIQASSQRALDRGTTPRAALEALSKARLQVPVVLMGYYNSALRPGLEEFAKLASESGASGTILSDLIPEEADDWIATSRRHGLANVFLAAPTSTDARLDVVCERSQGFVYAVSRTGVTGAGSQVPPEVKRLVERIRARTDKPVCVGFGISTPDHVRMVCEVADGAVIGSWLVDLLASKWAGGRGRAEVMDQVAELKAATL